MIITRTSREVEGVVYKTVGHGKKEHKEPLFKIVVPAHLIVYDIKSGNLEDKSVEVIVFQAASTFVPVAKGNWSLQTFSDFVDGVRAVTETAAPYIEDSLLS